MLIKKIQFNYFSQGVSTVTILMYIINIERTKLLSKIKLLYIYRWHKFRLHPKLSLLISVGEDTDLGSAVVGVLSDHLLLRQFGMYPKFKKLPETLICISNENIISILKATTAFNNNFFLNNNV